jgi:hypothetical protein
LLLRNNYEIEKGESQQDFWEVAYKQLGHPVKLFYIVWVSLFLWVAGGEQGACFGGIAALPCMLR